MSATLPRCDKCKGLAPEQTMPAMVTTSSIQMLLRELEAQAVPAEFLLPIRTWAADTFKRCSCPRDLFGLGL